MPEQMDTTSQKPQTVLLEDVWITSGIFSNHYLLERLPQAGAKIWTKDEEVSPAHKSIRELYEKNIVGLRKGNEANTERRFIDKVFNELGFGYLNQDKIPEAGRRQVPDYFLYSTSEDADKAFELSPYKKYKLAISIAESKRWDHNLDQPASGKGKATKGRYPHQQIRDYLNESEHIKWGILTNAKEWRIYFKEGRSSKFFEIDLEACLEDLQKFKYFYLLFSPNSFIKDSSGRCLLDSIFDESLRFQENVEKDLRVKVFNCVERLGRGFLSRKENNLSEKDLESIYHHSLILLYRILFVLNAEARDLLPTNPQTNYYKHYGIQKIKDRVRYEKGEFINAKTVLYDDLSALFHLINGSNEKLNRDMNIPRYNGGLFDPDKYKFLEEKKVGDDVLSEVIYELSYRTDKNGDVHSIDYKGLGERHLGTVYEGLLEHKLVSDNNKVILENDKGERKATGAYYTPDYIVKYIVENTLGPIIKRIDEKSIPTLAKGGRGDLGKDDSFAEEVLNLNICDPAMGSGHFLVEAVQYLADEIAYHPTTQLKTAKGETEDEINYWKRKVVESCIYGVDIKELAVELAKLSLWLKTVDRNQPLNFLDHHLRCGNSLIGARISDLNYLPQSKRKQKKTEEHESQLALFDRTRFKEDITTVIKGFHSIEEMPSEKISDIKAKEKTFQKLVGELLRYREIADLWTSLLFGNSLEEKQEAFEDIIKEQDKFQMDIFGQEAKISAKKKSKAGISNQIYNFIVSSLQSPNGKTQLPKLALLLEKSVSIAREKRFFHWEIEFPEVFFNEDGSPKENSGFDCVIGNPPYVRFHTLYKTEIEYFSKLYRHAIGQFDLFSLMVEKSFGLLTQKGYFGFITSGLFLKGLQYAPLREMLLKKTAISNIVDLGDKVFPDAEIPTCIFTYNKAKNPKNVVSFYKGGFGNPQQVEQIFIEKTPYYPFDAQASLIIPKLMDKSISLEEISEIARGIEIGKDKIQEKHLNSKDKIVYSGDEIDRYIPKGEVYISQEIAESYAKNESIFKAPKIMVRETGGELIGCYDDRGIITLRTVHNIHITNNAIDYKYVLALLNSRLLQKVFELCFKQAGDIFPKIRIAQERQLPIFSIAFTTPSKERKKFFEEAVDLYDDLKYEDILKWADYELDMGRNDTIHDSLAYLAEQMIELNKVKNEESRGFLKWLEREIGAEIDTLINKTAVKGYHEHGFEHLLKVLKKNQNKISIDPSDRRKQELLEKHFTKSMSVLEPLKEKIKTTDRLIDKIVYKLYGLTDKKIEIVEGKSEN